MNFAIEFEFGGKYLVFRQNFNPYYGIYKDDLFFILISGFFLLRLIANNSENDYETMKKFQP